MKIFEELSIKYKLVAIIMLTSGVTLFLASAVFVAKDFIITRHVIVGKLSSMTQVIGMNSEGALVFDDQYTARKNLAALHVMPYVLSACIYDKDGDIFAAYRRQDSEQSVAPPNYQELSQYFEDKKHKKKPYINAYNYNYCFEKDMLFLYHQILSENEVVGSIFIQYDLEQMMAVKHAGFIFVVILSMGFCVALVLSHSLQRIISKPILTLAQTARAISVERDYSIRARCDCYRDEIGYLFDGFNEMLAEIQTQQDEIYQHREKEKRHLEE